MVYETSTNPVTGKKEKITKTELKERIEAKLITRGVYDPENATEVQLYQATVQVIKDIMLEYRSAFRKRIRAVDGKKICYLCMEFLVGRSLKNDSMNLGIYDEICEIMSDFGSSFDKIYACEVDPGLGNGGLGRLAACFMDSLSALDYAANGYSLLYENGLFKQKIIDGEQVELPDNWLGSGGAWLVPRPEKSITVRFGGRIEEKWENGELKIMNYDYDEVKAVPYDLLIPGTVTNAVNKICLWRSRQAYSSVVSYASQGSYVKDLSKSNNA